MLKILYTFFLGILIATFVGLGVATFYPQPKYPEYPRALEVANNQGKPYTQEQQRIFDKYNQEVNKHHDMQNNYDRNVAIITLVAAVALLVVSMVLSPKMDIVSDGMLLGGVFTLIYSIGRSFSANNPKVSFGVVTVGLIITIILGYRKFAEAQTNNKSAAKSNKKK